MNTAAIIDPTRRVPLRSGEHVRVHELAWFDALQFFERLGQHATRIGHLLLDDPSIAAAAAAGDRKAMTQRVLHHMAELITGTTDLAAFLIDRSLAEADREKIKSFRATDALRVLRAALELTLNDDIISEGNAIAAALGKAFMKAIPTTAATDSSNVSGPNPTSSGRDITSPWSAPTPSPSSGSTAGSAATD